MSHDTTISTDASSRNMQESERNMQGQIMYDRIPSCDVTRREGETGTKKRAAPVGLRSGGRGPKYTWAEKLEARYLTKPEIGCWEVAGYQLPRNGYVQIAMGRTGESGHEVKVAHRVAYELAYGPVPDGLIVAHKCDNPRCARPDHLVATTQAENVRDSIRKGRYNTFGIQKLNAEQVLAIREMSANGDPQHVIAARFGIARNTVSQIANHKIWAHLTKPVDGPQPVADLSVRNVEPVRTVQVPIRGELHVGSLSTEPAAQQLNPLEVR